MDLLKLKVLSAFNRIKFTSLVVIIYIVCEYKMVTINGGKGKWWIFGLLYLVDVFFFYFNCYLIYPRSYDQRKTVLQPIVLVLFTLSLYYSTLIFTYVATTVGIQGFFANLNGIVMINYLWRVFLVSSFALIPFGFATYTRILKREKILENNVLYSRVSPHMLFNALNFVHADLRELSPRSDKMITYLSEYARYAMDELAEDGKANLEAELSQLDILIKIHELRFEKMHLKVHVSLLRNVYDYRIPPHLILTLAENLFKYGETKEPEKEMVIEVFDENTFMHVRLSNWKTNSKDVVSHKIGLDNLRKRLKNIYGDFFTMKIDEDVEKFSAHIIVPI